jgi:hypothetical protein
MYDDGPRLPLELVDQVVGISQTDPDTVKACSSVCVAWNAIARSYIFGRVRVRDEILLDDLESILYESPEIGACVRELTFGPFTPRKTYRASMRWVTRIPKVLPRVLTSVQTIRFERLSDAAEYCDASFFRLFHGFTSATTLVLDDSAVNMPTLQAFACSLPNMNEFVVVGMLPLMVNVWPPPPFVDKARFTSLILDFAVQPSTTMIDFIAWFERSNACRTVTSLEVAIKVLDAKHVSRLLVRLGPNLRHLGLKMQALFSSDWEYDREESYF